VNNNIFSLNRVGYLAFLALLPYNQVISSVLVLAALDDLTINAPTASTNYSGVITFNATTAGNGTNASFYYKNTTSTYLACQNLTANTPPGEWICVNDSSSTIADGTYNVTANATNSTDDTVEATEIQDIIVDNTAPTWSTNQSSVPLTYSPSTSSEFNITWTDATTDVSVVFIEGNWSTCSSNCTMGTTYGSGIYNYTQILPAGAWSWKVYANDSLDNWNTSDEWTVTIGNASNPVTLLLNGSAANVSYQYANETNASCSATAGAPTLYRNDTDKNSTDNYQNVQLGVGMYIYNCTTPGNANYSANLTGPLYNLTITQAVPTLNVAINSTESNLEYAYGNVTNTSAWETNSGDSGCTYNFYRDGAAVGSSEEVILLGAGNYTYLYNTSGCTNYSSNSETRLLNLTRIASVATVSILPASTVTYPNTTTTWCNITTGDSGATLNLYRNGSSKATGAGNQYETILLGADVYNYSCTYAQSENYSASSDLNNYLTVSQNSSTANFMNLTINGTESNKSYTYPAVSNATGWNSITQLTFTLYSKSYNLTINQADNPVTLYLNGTSNSNVTYTYPESVNATGTATVGTASLYRDGAAVGAAVEQILLGNGTYEYKVNVTSGNANYSDNATGLTYYALVNKGTVTLALYLNGTAANNTYTYPEPVGALGNKTTTVNNEGNLSLYRDGSIVNTSLTADEATENILLGNNSHNYSLTFTATNYSDTSIVADRFALVNKGPVNVTLYLNGSRADTSYGPGVIANFTVVSNVSGKTVNLTTNITGWVDDTNTTPLINYTTIPSVASGTYNITGYFVGDANYSAASETWYTTTNDTTDPTVTTFELSSSTIEKGDALTITWNVTDNVAVSEVYIYQDSGEIVNTTINDSSTSLTMDTAGTIEIHIRVTDSNGNTAISSETVTVFTSTVGGGGSSYTPTGTTTNVGSLTAPTQQEMSKGDTMNFNIGTTSHSAKVTSMGSNYVYIKIFSDPITIKVLVNETKEVDIDGDGVNDLSVYLEKIEGGTAYLTYTPIGVEEQQPEEPEVEEVPEPSLVDEAATPTYDYAWAIAIVVVIMVIAAVAYSGKGTKKRRK